MEYFYGELFFKNRFYTWKFNPKNETLTVYDSSFKELRKFKIDPRKLKRKHEILELVKLELAKPAPQITIDYSAYNDVREEGVEWSFLFIQPTLSLFTFYILNY